MDFARLITAATAILLCLFRCLCYSEKRQSLSLSLDARSRTSSVTFAYNWYRCKKTDATGIWRAVFGRDGRHARGLREGWLGRRNYLVSGSPRKPAAAHVERRRSLWAPQIFWHRRGIGPADDRARHVGQPHEHHHRPFAAASRDQLHPSRRNHSLRQLHRVLYQLQPSSFSRRWHLWWWYRNIRPGCFQISIEAVIEPYNRIIVSKLQTPQLSPPPSKEGKHDVFSFQGGIILEKLARPLSRGFLQLKNCNPYDNPDKTKWNERNKESTFQLVSHEVYLYTVKERISSTEQRDFLV